jgi:hypothetical protein
MKALVVLLVLVVGIAVAQQNLVVYNGTTGKLTAGWLNFSWAKVNLTSTEEVKSGDKYAISMVCTGWQGLYLSQPTLWDAADYNTFSFWVNGGATPSSVDMTVQIIATNNSANLQVSDYLPNHAFPENSWVQVLIPLTHFSLISSEVKGFWFQANSASGAVVYFDDIQFSFAKVPPIPGPALTIEASNPVPINPQIYGVTIFWNGPMEDYVAFAKEIKLPLNRNGGDATTRYNWNVDSSNAGFDWYFVGGNGQNTSTPGAGPDYFITTNIALGITPTITIPMIQYINKESEYHCSFPKSIYPNQQSFNPYVHPNGDSCGNGLNTTGGNIIDKDPLATDILNTADIQQKWVQHIVSKFGNSAKSGIIYQLDNEVSNWAYMHRDVHPQPVTYPEIVNQTILYASAVKQADPTAKVAAPSEIQFGWYPDWGGTKNVQYFLQELQAYEKAHGIRLVDTYDAHYPDAGDNHWPILKDVDTVRKVIDETYPGTGLSFSEWTLAGLGPLGGALAIADQLGHYAKNQVAWASIWGLGDTDLTAPVSYGLRIYRNYDGKGSEFGDSYVNSTSAGDGTLSVHAALRSSDSALTILVINKIASDQTSTVSISNFSFKASSTAIAYKYSNANASSIVETSVTLGQTGFSATFVAFSLTLVVIPKA